MTIDGNLCFETNQVLLQPGNYFGVSASTGETPDHHQLFGFKITPLEAAGNAPPTNQHVLPDAKDRTPRGNAAAGIPVVVPAFLGCLLITGPRVEESSRSFGETVERSYGRNTNYITSHRNLHRYDLALNRLALPNANTSPG